MSLSKVTQQCREIGFENNNINFKLRKLENCVNTLDLIYNLLEVDAH